jgi:hypothetical protein
MGAEQRIRKLARGAWLAAALALAGAVAYASSDGGLPPTWELAKDRYDPAGGAALLTPANDTRVNLLLLLADRREAPVRDPRARREGPPLVLFSWGVMAKDAVAPSDADPDEWHEPSRCQSNAAGSAAFVAALRANGRVPPEEKERLAAARAAFVPDCSGAGSPPAAVGASSPAGKAFEAYLRAGADFYGGRFEAARSAFAALGRAPDPWLRETAAYMVARTELNRAQQGSLDEYGSLAEPDRRDLAAAAAAGAAFASYLKAYPKGRYASSARGLTRRVAWLAGNKQALAEAFGKQISARGPLDGAATAVSLSEEIDLKLLGEGGAGASRDPLLLAVDDLQRLRCVDDPDTPAADCAPRLGKAELERQAPLFDREAALFGYLRAAEAYFVRHEPREVVALIPDAARQKRFSYVEFSRQVLRGMALDAVGDRSARAFWLSLFDGAVQPYQREALELGLALHEERSGGVERVFAPESRVRHPLIRQLLLEHIAGPDLLRRQANDAGVPKLEREIAAYVLLAKELRRGFYREFLDDVRLVPADSPEEGYYSGAAYYDPRYDSMPASPPLRLFGAKAPVGEAGCPALLATVRQLAAAPKAVRPRLCLAEYFRVNGFDGLELEEPVPGSGLGTSKSLFPGQSYQRLEVYKAIIADPAAMPEDRALALNRAVRCYAPTGNNTCGGTEVPLEQRRAWFARLKRDYPKSPWARSLDYYW